MIPLTHNLDDRILVHARQIMLSHGTSKHLDDTRHIMVLCRSGRGVTHWRSATERFQCARHRDFGTCSLLMELQGVGRVESFATKRAHWIGMLFC